MKTFRLNKLVKDKILDLMQEQGQKVTYRILEDEEFEQRIKEKIVEEAKEYLVSGDAKELDDLLEIILAAKQVANPTAEISAKGEIVKSSFKKRIFVETVTMENDSTWARYYQGDPVRFQELPTD